MVFEVFFVYYYVDYIDFFFFEDCVCWNYECFMFGVILDVCFDEGVCV